MDGILLTLRLQAGDPRAFDVVVRRHHASVFRQLWHLCGNAETAADLTQETFMQAARSIRSVRSSASLRAWLGTILLRVWGRWVQGEHAASQIPTVAIEALGDELADPAAGPAERLLSETAAVRAAVLSLTDACRVPVVLHYYAGLKYHEIADVLGVPIGTVQSRLQDALRQLRVRLDDDASTHRGTKERR